MKEIGGFFELSMSGKTMYHNDAIALNSARNCLKYLLYNKKPKKIYVPAYCCNSLIEPILELSIDIELYHIDKKFELLELLHIKEDERLVYINYFGLKGIYVSELADVYGSKLIIDNTQAFFDKPIKDIDTIYSARKFFGVSDGGFLYTKIDLPEIVSVDLSGSRFQHVIGRLELDASSYYKAYQQAEESLKYQPIKKMSALTKMILANTDYSLAALTRQRNYWFLHSHLSTPYKICHGDLNCIIPMVFPYFVNDKKLKYKLIENEIYTATYWVDASERANEVERIFIDEVIYLPIDQRYSLDDMKKIVEVIND
ncbi:hypothetical protein [Aeromonas media]|uniref:hypothetical protein n=1 Tax=Aeromonas media TaxID=651 RepID=UPI00370C4E1D